MHLSNPILLFLSFSIIYPTLFSFIIACSLIFGGTYNFSHFHLFSIFFLRFFPLILKSWFVSQLLFKNDYAKVTNAFLIRKVFKKKSSGVSLNKYILPFSLLFESLTLGFTSFSQNCSKLMYESLKISLLHFNRIYG
jgi:hypothetical protein